MAEWKSTRVKTGLSSGEGLINEVPDPVRDGPKVIDPGVEDKRLLILEGRVRRYPDDDASSR